MHGQSRVLDQISQNMLQLVNFIIPTPRPIPSAAFSHPFPPIVASSTLVTQQSNGQNETHHSPLLQPPRNEPSAHPPSPRRRTISITEPPRLTFELRAAACVTLGEIEQQYVHVTLSPTGSAIVLMTHLTFQILAIPPKGTSMHTYRDLRPAICCGCNDGRFGPNFETMSLNARDDPDFRPRYMRAALGEEILCIAGYSSKEHMIIDIHDALTGHRKKSLTVPGLCWLVKLSPDEKILAVATDSPCRLYTFIVEGPGNQPLWSSDKSDKWINCMAFSPDSLYLSVCNSDGIILTYSLEMVSQNATASPISKFHRNVRNKGLHFGIKHLTL